MHFSVTHVGKYNNTVSKDSVSKNLKLKTFPHKSTNVLVPEYT